MDMQNLTSSELASELKNAGLDAKWADVLEENEINGSIFPDVTEGDLYEMFPKKVGVVRLIINLRKKLTEFSANAQQTGAEDATDTSAVQSKVTDAVLSTIATTCELTEAVGQIVSNVIISAPPEAAPTASVGTHPTLPIWMQATTVATAAVGQTSANVMISAPPEATPTVSVGTHPTLSVSMQATTIATAVSQPASESRAVKRKASLQFPLPTFSRDLETELKDGKVSMLSTLLRECANYIQENDQNFKTSDKYRAFGKALYEKYPAAIAFKSGKHPWSFISSKISEKMRNMRHARKTNVGEPSTSGQALQLAEVDQSQSVSEMDLEVQEASKKLDEEVRKSFGDLGTLKQLFSVTRGSRRNSIKNLPPQTTVSEICGQYPLLDKIIFIRDEFFAIQEKTREEMLDNYLDVLRRLDHIQRPGVDGDDESDDWHAELDIILLLQRSLSDGRFQRSLRRPAVEVINDDAEAPQASPLDPPSLAVVKPKDNSMPKGVILADGLTIPLEVDDHDSHPIFSMLIDLMACYYTWDLSYPKAYQILPFFQTYIICDNANPYFASTKFKTLQKQFDP